ncbi:hypothetical protein C1886_05020 [Pseudomonas sp. FW300-N1A1]|nr:hypothetical protein C1886_05020 [Pseudomonas sp. FW300-N1A1]
MVRSGSLRNPAGASSLATERVCSQGVGCRTQASWRASLLALGCTAAPRPVTGLYLKDCDGLLRVATQPSGSKLPRHREGMQSRSGGCRTQASWRASLLALGCTAAPKPVCGF